MCNLSDQLSNMKEPELLPYVDRKIGFRWCEIRHGGVLGPISYNGDEVRNPWKQFVAYSDKAPKLDNTNGLYLFTALKEALRQGYNCGYLHRAYALVKVEYWGQLVHHKLGVRAERAKMTNIFIDEGNYFRPGNIRYWEVPMTLDMNFREMCEQEGVDNG
jgi:hypothetical protein